MCSNNGTELLERNSYFGMGQWWWRKWLSGGVLSIIGAALNRSLMEVKRLLTFQNLYRRRGCESLGEASTELVAKLGMLVGTQQ